MKAKELMLFDLVKRKKDGKVMTVVELRYAETIAAITPDDVYYGDMEDYHESEIDPISLTPEILEKNGFEKDPESGELIWTDDDVTEIVWVGTILTIRGEYANAEFATCMFVHQLQHALRLCGIEHEITL